MKKHIPEISISLKDIIYNNSECDGGFINGKVFVTLPNKKEYQVEGYVDLFTFLLNRHHLSTQSSFIDIKTFRKYHNKHNDPFFQINKQQFSRFQQIKNRLSATYLDSCNCGYPECAGFENGVHINKLGEYLVYSVGKKEGYTKGILETGFKKVKIHIDNIEVIRKLINQKIQL